MPALFSLGLHAALCAVSRLLPNERLLDFLNDIHALCRPERVSWRSKKSCGPTHGFRSIKGKPNCGTRVRIQTVGKFSLPPPAFQTPRQSCGGVILLSLAEQG